MNLFTRWILLLAFVAAIPLCAAERSLDAALKELQAKGTKLVYSSVLVDPKLTTSEANISLDNLDTVLKPHNLRTKQAADGTVLIVKGQQDTPAGNSNVGVVSFIKVLSDKSEDISSPEAWKRTYIKDGMTDQEKAIALWKTVVKYRHQCSPPKELLQNLGCVHDPFKTFHVYGYGMCCCASSNIEGLARYIGLQARGRIINAHSVPEVYYDNAWHLLDGSLMSYYTKDDGKIASVDEVRKAVMDWWKEHPEHAGMRGDDNKLHVFARNENWRKSGPKLMSTSPFYDKDGINPAGWHGWPSTMSEYDWSDEKAAVFEYGPSMGYQLNIQLRPGEKLTRNWFNQNKLVPGDEKEEVLNTRKPLDFQTRLGDGAPGRIGNGSMDYEVPLASPAFKASALTYENLAVNGGALNVEDAAKPGVLVVRVPCSYVFLGGKLNFTPALGEGGSVTVSFSDNHGLDWKELSKVTASGAQSIKLNDLIYRRYDYRLKFELNGKGTGLSALNIHNEIQHSQAPLPLLGQGENTITFSTGANEGTITYEGNLHPENSKDKQLAYTSFKPEIKGFEIGALYMGKSPNCEAIFTLNTPGDMARIRMSTQYRARDAKDGYEIQASYDDGKTYTKVEDLAGPTAGLTRYMTFSEIPAGTKTAKVKFIGRQRNTTCMFDLRLDADYKEPSGGFTPVKVTYTWEENGQAKSDVHVCKTPNETYKINCATKPLMKSIVLELAQ